MNQDLRSRIPIGLAYAGTIAASTLLSSGATLILLAFFYLICMHEYVQAMMHAETSSKIYVYGASLLVMASVLLPELRMVILPLAILSAGFILLNIVRLLTVRKSWIIERPLWLMALLYLTLPFLLTLVFVIDNPDFHRVLLGVFIIVWLNDAGAYFAGKAFGKHKMMPSVSPNKSWEGLIGGGLVGLIVSQALTPVLGTLTQGHWLILSVIIWITGSYGDLIQSSWKRHLGLKDSGTILKGHGGFLDRLDSFIFAIPFVIVYLLVVVG